MIKHTIISAMIIHAQLTLKSRSPGWRNAMYVTDKEATKWD